MKTKVMDLWAWATDMVLLNVMWFVFSIPVVTIGASTVALWDVMLQRIRNEEPFIIKDFYRSFRHHFKRATLAWGFVLGIGLLLVTNFVICHVFQELQILELVFAAFFLCLIGFCQYIFPLVSQCEKPLRELIKTAAFLAIGFLPKTMMVTSVALFPLIIAVCVSRSMFGMLLCTVFVVAFSIWINARTLNPIFVNSIDTVNVEK